MSRLDPPRLNRRSFLNLASLGSFFAALGTATAGIFRLPNPAVLPGPVRRFKLGPPERTSPASDIRWDKHPRSHRKECSARHRKWG
jgi:hypothetical protein